jgi:putative colanic acid biosynthesis acetyltransferase WcaB
MGVTLEAIRADWKANAGIPKSRLALLLFRLSHHCFLKRKRKTPLFAVRFIFRAFYRLLVEWVLGVELPDGLEVGPGLQLHHGQALVVNGRTIIGRDCVLRHATTIGCARLADGSQGPCPVIGDGVEIGSNAVILGGITIHDGAKIGAGSVVVHDVPARAVVVGNPAKVIKYTRQP